MLNKLYDMGILGELSVVYLSTRDRATLNHRNRRQSLGYRKQAYRLVNCSTAVGSRSNQAQDGRNGL